MRICSMLILTLTLLLSISAPLKAGPEPIAVIAHPSAGADTLGAAELRALFTLAQKRWNNGSPAIVFNLPPRHDLRSRFDEAVLGMGPEQAAKFWIDQRIRGKGQPPRHVPNEALMARVIGKLRGSLGYVSASHVPDDVVVVARIIDGEVRSP